MNVTVLYVERKAAMKYFLRLLPNSQTNLPHHSGWAAPARGGPADLREGGLLVQAGGRRESVRALQGRPRLVSAVRHPRDDAGTGTQRCRHSTFPLSPKLFIHIRLEASFSSPKFLTSCGFLCFLL